MIFARVDAQCSYLESIHADWSKIVLSGFHITKEIVHV